MAIPTPGYFPYDFPHFRRFHQYILAIFYQYNVLAILLCSLIQLRVGALFFAFILLFFA